MIIDTSEFSILLVAAIMSFSTFAKIEQIVESNKGYTKITLANHIPWHTRHLTFNVWHKAKLRHGDETFKVDDDVIVRYRPGTFDRLVSLELAILDICPTCYAFYELPPDAQKIDCGLCSPFDIDRQDRAPTEMKLISKTYKQCAFSKGLCLSFVDDNTGALYFAWSYEGKPNFEKFATLETMRKYNICGWITKTTDEGNFGILLTHVPDLCE